MLYQAFLEIGFCVSTPFEAGADSAKLPIDELIAGWIEDLKHANEMAVKPPGWQAPCFKPKAKVQVRRSEDGTPTIRNTTVKKTLR